MTIGHTIHSNPESVNMHDTHLLSLVSWEIPFSTSNLHKSFSDLQVDRLSLCIQPVFHEYEILVLFFLISYILLWDIPDK